MPARSTCRTATYNVSQAVVAAQDESHGPGEDDDRPQEVPVRRPVGDDEPTTRSRTIKPRQGALGLLHERRRDLGPEGQADRRHRGGPADGLLHDRRRRRRSRAPSIVGQFAASRAPTPSISASVIAKGSPLTACVNAGDRGPEGRRHAGRHHQGVARRQGERAGLHALAMPQPAGTWHAYRAGPRDSGRADRRDARAACRRARERPRRLRSSIVALVSTVVVFGVLALDHRQRAGLASVQQAFFNPEVFAASLPDIVRAFWVNVAALPDRRGADPGRSRLVIAVMRSLPGPGFFPFRGAGDRLLGRLPRRARASWSSTSSASGSRAWACPGVPTDPFFWARSSPSRSSTRPTSPRSTGRASSRSIPSQEAAARSLGLSAAPGAALSSSCRRRSGGSSRRCSTTSSGSRRTRRWCRSSGSSRSSGRRRSSSRRLQLHAVPRHRAPVPPRHDPAGPAHRLAGRARPAPPRRAPMSGRRGDRDDRRAVPCGSRASTSRSASWRSCAASTSTVAEHEVVCLIGASGSRQVHAAALHQPARADRRRADRRRGRRDHRRAASTSTGSGGASASCSRPSTCSRT